MSSPLDCDIKNAVATVTLMREDKHNALSPELIAELTQCFTQLSQDQNVRTVVVQSQGKTFCAGADLTWMKESIEMSALENLDSAKALYDMYYGIYTCPKPVIARVQGSAFGGGVGLIACMDVAIMMEHASLSLSELRLGLIPSTIAPFLYRKVGLPHLRYYGLSSRRIPAQEGKDIGLIQHVVQSENELDQEVASYVETFQKLSPQAISAYKKMCEVMPSLSLLEARNHTSEEIAKIRTTEQAQEGLAAFFEKRSPNWESSS